MAWVHLVLFALFTGVGVEMVRAIFQRRRAIALWRSSVGGGYDARQHRFVTDLDLDRADLPPDARALLLRSRRSLLACLIAMAVLMAVQVFVMMGL